MQLAWEYPAPIVLLFRLNATFQLQSIKEIRPLYMPIQARTTAVVLIWADRPIKHSLSMMANTLRMTLFNIFFYVKFTALELS